MKIKDTEAVLDVQNALSLHFDLVDIAFQNDKPLTNSQMEDLRDGLRISYSKICNFITDNKIKA